MITARLAFALVVACIVGLVGMAALSLVAVPAAAIGAGCDPAVREEPATVGGFDAEQVGHARTIIDVGQQLGVPARGWLVALATAMQESTLRNLDHGDRDSLGLFQQRPSQGWGTRGQVRDPEHAARSFYERLVAIPRWERLPVTVAAQRVQRSAFPGAYAKWERRAAGLVEALGGIGDVSGCSGGSTEIGAALAFARGQLGKPYRWGGTGPGSFDCSGLVLRAYEAAGVTLPRTSRAQFGAGAKVPLERAAPGDLVFWASNPENPATIRHVALVVEPGKIVEAPSPGLPVRVRALRPAERGLLPVAVRPAAQV